jgi:hypothetical protein
MVMEDADALGSIGPRSGRMRGNERSAARSEGRGGALHCKIVTEWKIERVGCCRDASFASGRWSPRTRDHRTCLDADTGNLSDKISHQMHGDISAIFRCIV